MRELLLELLRNTIMLLAMSAVYTLIPFSRWGKRSTSFLIGGIVSVIAITVMTNGYALFPGVLVDSRSILLSTCGLFFGFGPTLIVAFTSVVFRIMEGGTGVVAGIVIIVSAAGIGLVWRYTRLQTLLKNKKSRWLELAIMGILVHLVMLYSLIILPDSIKVAAIKTLAAPILLLFPLGTIGVGLLFFNQYDRQETQHKLLESESRYRSLYENDHFAMMLINPEDGTIVDANRAACVFYGWSREQLQSMTIWQINTLPKAQVLQNMAQAKSKTKTNFRFQHSLASGEIRHVEVFSGPLQLDGRNLLYSIVHDITDRVRAENMLRESEERFRVTLLSVGDGVIATDRLSNITIMNEAARAITGWVAEEKIGKPINDCFHIINEYTRARVENPVQKVLETGTIIGLANHTILICEDGTEKSIADSAAPIMDDKGTIQGAVIVFRDVTEEQKKREEIQYLGFHDVLTGLHNRRFFDECRVLLDKEENLPISIIVGDVNGLKITNDAFGHAAGDQLLVHIADVIKQVCRDSDITARWGGDEFIILLCKTDEKQAIEICDNIQRECALVKTECGPLSISLGSDTKYKQSESVESVIKNAEDWMYRKKAMESFAIRGNTINAILSTLHEISPRERQHSDRVSVLCQSIGEYMKMSEREVSELYLCGLMHDIGKITVAESILNKRGKLTEEEYAQMKRHPEVGYRILNASGNMSYIAEYVLNHHERIDGTGYPNGLTGENIPIQSKILAIADSFDAMVSERPYQKAMSYTEAVAELRRCSGTQFDTPIVEAFVRHLIKNC